MPAPSPLHAALNRMQAIRVADAAANAALQNFLADLEETGALAAVDGFPGILDLSLVLRQMLADCLANNAPMDALDLSVLAGWPETLLQYLGHPDSAEHKDQLLEIARYPAWGAALGEDDAALLRAQLDIEASAAEPRRSAELEWEEEAAPPAAAVVATTGAGDGDNVPADLRELVAIMVAELSGIRQSLAGVVQQLSHPDRDPDACERALHELGRGLQFYAEAVVSIEFHGLAGTIQSASENLAQAIAAKEPGAQLAVCALLQEWSEAVLHYLRAPMQPDRATSLLGLMSDSRWPAPIGRAKTDALLARFGAAPVMTPETGRPKTRAAATAGDVSIALPKDVDQDLLEALLQELPAQTEALTVALQRLAGGGDSDDLLLAKRMAHTLKGAGNTVGIRGIATLTHHLEDILLTLHKQHVMPPAPVTQTLMSAADCLSAMSESLLGRGEPPEDALLVLQDILNMAGLLEAGGIERWSAGQSDAQPAPAAATAEPAVAPEAEADAVPMLRIPAHLMDQLLRMSAETQIMYGQLQNFIQQTSLQVKEVRGHFEQLRGLGGKMEELADVKDLNQAGNAARDDGYDSLEMDQYSELHSYSRRIAEITVDANEANKDIAGGLAKLKEVIATQARLNNETQSLMLKTRMLPANTNLQRWQRCVRQAARLTGKQVSLRVLGGDTLIDGTILNGLLDPLMHLLRNAVDHGIESAAVRSDCGKPAAGTIELEFSRVGSYIHVECRDDGRGLNLEAIRAQAVSKGMLAADQDISDEELQQFVLQPDFSTKQEVSQVSGRGIGMDAVYSSIVEQSGTLSLKSVAGRGCTVQIRLPQDMLSIFGLLVRAGPRLVVLASRGIAQVVHHELYQVRGEGGELQFQMQETQLQAVALERLLGLDLERRQGGRHPRTAIIFNTEGGPRAVLVERILASQLFAVKGLGDFVPKLPGIVGATLLGDGTVAPVLDVTDLLRLPIQVAPPPESGNIPRKSVTAPTALVVDDSLSARRSLAQFMHDVGYQVRQARDGSEALEIIHARCPDILLSDLEMPRMNGLELAGHVRADPRTARLPIILITSRATPRHQQEAMSAGVDAYLTKPFSEERLLAEIQRLLAAAAT